jgi:hypothetical protein
MLHDFGSIFFFLCPQTLSTHLEARCFISRPGLCPARRTMPIVTSCKVRECLVWLLEARIFRIAEAIAAFSYFLDHMYP